MSQTNATLHLNFRVRDHQTILRVLKQEPPLRVIRAFPIDTGASLAAAGPDAIDPGAIDPDTVDTSIDISATNGSHANGIGINDGHVKTAQPTVQQPVQQPVQPTLVHLHNVSGGILGGDQLRLEANVGVKAQAQLTSTSSTRVYRHRQHYPVTRQEAQLTVAAGGLLEYLPDTLIPYARSQYRQTTRIELAEDAGLFYWEVIAPGREAKGECFDYDLLQIELDIMAADRPIAVERVRLQPKMPTARRTEGMSLAQLGTYRYFATFYICRVGVAKQDWIDLEARLDQEARVLTERGHTIWGVSTLPAHGLSVRAVGRSSHAIQQQLPIFWQIAKESLYKQNAVMPRKIY